MAKRSKMGTGPKIVGLIFLILVFSIAGSIWFDYVGIIDISGLYAPVFRLIGLETRSERLRADDPGIIDNIRLQKEREALLLREQELENQLEELEIKEQELVRTMAEIEEREAVLQEREKSFNQRVSQYDNRRENLIQNSRDLTNMRLESAVAILQGYDDQLLIETLRVTEELAQAAGEMSLVSVWLSSFPPERAAEIQRKMTIRPGG
ncbi:MAG: flagellar protein FlbB [Spirochaetaceae bacterium]|nr:MAG: flagellar protein FlbB [Spirochaetaceae bacterium]